MNQKITDIKATDIIPSGDGASPPVQTPTTPEQIKKYIARNK